MMESILIVSSVLLWILLAFNLLLTLALVRRINKLQVQGPPIRELETLPVGTPAPDFVAETLAGGTKTLSDYLGRSVVFVFSSSLCRPCVKKIPGLEKLAPEAREAGLEFVIVSVDDRSTTQEFVKKQGVTLPVLIAPMGNNRFTEDYKAKTTPFYCHIDEQGKVKSSGIFELYDVPDWMHPEPGREVIGEAAT